MMTILDTVKNRGTESEGRVIHSLCSYAAFMVHGVNYHKLEWAAAE